MKALSLDIDSTTESFKSVEIQPVVIFSILDHFIRRDPEEENGRVIGTLLGRVEDGVVIVSNCFIVPHTETDKALYIKSSWVSGPSTFNVMCNLFAEINPEERIVGWYSTSKDSTANNVWVNEWYKKEMNSQPIFLSVDTTLKSVDWVKCYYLYQVQIGGRGVLQHQFRPLRHTFLTDQSERTILNAARQNTAPVRISDLDSLVKSLQDLVEMLDTVKKYVDNVASGQTKGSTKLAKLIDETLALIPVNTSGKFEDLFTRGLQDILACVYLAKLTNAHLLLANLATQNATDRD